MIVPILYAQKKERSVPIIRNAITILIQNSLDLIQSREPLLSNEKLQITKNGKAINKAIMGKNIHSSWNWFEIEV